MGHIAFAAPAIERFHLHERLARELRRRGHAVTVLCLDRIEGTFWRRQEPATRCLATGPADPMRAPLDEFALAEGARRGLVAGSARHRRTVARVRDRLARLLPRLLRWFEDDRPDLVLLHQRRSAEARLVHFVARETGTRVLWTGAGLLPHTLQFDECGIDGDAAAMRRSAGDYRLTPNEPSLLQACLANAIGQTGPAALTRRDVLAPSLLRRFGDLFAALRRGDFAGAGPAIDAWRRAQGGPPPTVPQPADLPGVPFVAVLLQDAADERLRLDAAAAPSHAQLVVAAAQAARRVDRDLSLVVVTPPAGRPDRALAELRCDAPLYVVPAAAAAAVAATAVATVTVNHPLAVVALLAGTPVVHTGRARYGLGGVTTMAPTAGLARALPTALAMDNRLLRERFLSHLLGHEHLWCSPTHPDHNGVLGVVQTIEERLTERTPSGTLLRYRAGPAWPLDAAGRGS